MVFLVFKRLCMLLQAEICIVYFQSTTVRQFLLTLLPTSLMFNQNTTITKLRWHSLNFDTTLRLKGFPTQIGWKSPFIRFLLLPFLYLTKYRRKKITHCNSGLRFAHNGKLSMQIIFKKTMTKILHGNFKESFLNCEKKWLQKRFSSTSSTRIFSCLSISNCAFFSC